MSRRKQYRPIRLPEDDDDEDANGGHDGNSVGGTVTVATKDALSTTTPSEGVTNDDQLIINGNANDYSLAEARDSHAPSKTKSHLLTQDVENNNSNQSMDENGPKSPDPGQNHVTLGTLENTKVAVAQFTPSTSPPDKEKALKELAMLQTTLFSLQHQQVFQMQLIKQLQLQLAENDDDDALLPIKDQQQQQQQQPPLLPPPLQQTDDDEDNDVAGDELITTKTNNNTTNSEQTSFATGQHIDSGSSLELHAKETENPIINSLKKETSARSQSSSRCASPMRDFETEITRIQQSTSIRASPVNNASSMCQISSSLASTIITHDNNYPEPSELSSLEMLQKTAQESLDSASSGLLAGNLADELAFRREKSYSEGKNGKEALFKHRCRYCGKVFGSDSALQIHLRSHTGERPFKCNVCSSKFTTKGNLKVHYQRHTQRFPNIPLGHIPIPPEHLDKYHPALLAKLGNAVPPPPPSSPLPVSAPMYRPPLELFQPKSPDVESEARDLRKPMVESDSESENSPGKRRKMSEASSVTHLDSNDEMSNDNPPSMDEPENLSKLVLPKPRTPSPNERRSKRLLMMTTASKPPPFVALPPRPRSNDHSWENYIEIRKPSETETSKLQHLVDNIEHELTDPNQCLICHRILSCRSSLQMHYRIHTGERPFRCRLCGRSFTTKGNLKVHMSIHRLLPPMRSQHQCSVCHKKFLNSSVLQQHIRLHTGENIELTVEQIAAAEIQDFATPPEQPQIEDSEPYKSEEDGDEETRSPSPLDLTPRFKASPLRTKSQPSGHHPFRNFSILPIPPIHPASAFLARSLSLPTPPTPPPPQHRDFPQHFNPLNLAGIAGKGTTTCSICFKTFACHSALETHYRSHTKQKPFKCSLCNRSFSTKGNMKQHMQGHKSGMGTASQPDATDNSSLSSLDSTTTAAAAAQPVLDENNRYESGTIKHNRSANQSPDVLNLTRKAKKTRESPSPERRTSTSGPLVVDNPSNLSDNDSSSTPNNCLSSSPHNHLHQRQRHNFNLSPQRHHQRPDDIHSPDIEKLTDLVVAVDYDRHLARERQNRHITKRQQHGGKPNHKQTENFVFHQLNDHRTQQHISRFDNNDRQNRPDEHETEENDGEPSPLQILSPMAQLIFSQKQHQYQQSPLEKILRPQQMEQHERLHEPNSLSLLSTLAESSNSYPDNGQNTNQTATATVPPPPPTPTPPTSSTSPLCNGNPNASTTTSSSIVNNKLGIGDAKPLTATSATRIDVGPSIATTPFDASTNHVNSKHLCKVCRKNFSSSSALQIHFRTHTGDKPFRCHTCQKAFTTKGNLKVHMGIHMWTNSASRRGRRMSLELPLNRPHSMNHLETSDFASRRPDWFYPYIPPPPFLNGMPPKLPDIGHLSKYSSLMGFAPNFLPTAGIRPLPPQPTSPAPSLNSDRSSTEPTSPPLIKTEIEETDGLNLTIGARNNEVAI